ncbi:hypothetical protein LWI28_017833 [Acer negundo]|uniref:Uncharacterized protein n=1 Tax=Acer negundo TaxID=4023 RepID=A0AAD5J5F0_ACENE|nr:hypothetical protein LWI28_017833 [Acer negundo]
MRIATATLDTITLGQSIRDGETLVSADQCFELGFFSPGTSRSRYLGIWYKKVAPKTTVWVANRDTPISDPSGVLHINARGILVLFNSTNNTVWSSNSSRTPLNPVAVLLGSGNLVVKDGNDNNPDNFLWQSFYYPGDTLLPGMKLGINLVTGLEWFFTSSKSTDDPSQGKFTEMFDPRGTPQLFLKKGPVILYRAGSWNGLHLTGSQELKPNSIFAYNFVSNEKEVFYTYEIKDSSVLSRVVLTPSGVLQRFTWMDQTRTWAEYYARTRDVCDNYAKCGAYAICNVNNFPVCTCFEKFKPKSQRQWSLLNWSAGCIRKAQLDCQLGDGFLKLEAVKLPDTSHSRAEKYISLVECKKLCLSNCSCTAYATLDIREGGSGCLLWFNDLIDIKDIEGGQDLYVRVAASELGNIESRRQPSGKKKVNVIIIVASIISGMGALVLAWIMYMRKTKLKNEGHTDSNHEMDDKDEGSGKDDIGLTIYDLKTIAIATDNFSDKNKLGEGGFGPVYKGTLIEGQEIAIKRLSRSLLHAVPEMAEEDSSVVADKLEVVIGGESGGNIHLYTLTAILWIWAIPLKDYTPERRCLLFTLWVSSAV